MITIIKKISLSNIFVAIFVSVFGSSLYASACLVKFLWQCYIFLFRPLDSTFDLKPYSFLSLSGQFYQDFLWGILVLIVPCLVLSVLIKSCRNARAFLLIIAISIIIIYCSSICAIFALSFRDMEAIYIDKFYTRTHDLDEMDIHSRISGTDVTNEEKALYILFLSVNSPSPEIVNQLFEAKDTLTTNSMSLSAAFQIFESSLNFEPIGTGQDIGIGVDTARRASFLVTYKTYKILRKNLQID